MTKTPASRTRRISAARKTTRRPTSVPPVPIADWGIIGYEPLIARLKAIVARQDTGSAHAYLIIGPRGVGKRTLIEQFASGLACLKPQAGTACGNCQSCALAGRADHPDILRLSDDDTDRISVDAIRAVIHRLGHRPSIGRMRVCVLPRVDRCSEEAANALLKTLEEPPPQTVVLLTARHVSAVPPTVRSRCAVITLPVGPTQSVKAALMARGASPTDAAQAADLSGGRGEYGKLLAVNPQIRELVADDCQAFLAAMTAPIHERLRQAELLADHHEHLDELFDRWEMIARSLVYASAGLVLRGPLYDRVRSLAQRASILQARSVASALIEARRQLTVSNNPRLTLEHLFLHLPRL